LTNFVGASALLTKFPSTSVMTTCRASVGHEHEREKTVMTIGTVKFFNTTKGFGFIAPEEGGNDVFVHISAVERSGMRTLVEGQKVNFEAVNDRRTGKTAAENLSAA
jgi:CspA family cold shock protein